MALQKNNKTSLGNIAKAWKEKNSGTNPTLLMVYVRGITYMEVVALRFLSKCAGFTYHIITLTTSVINENNLSRFIV